MTATDEAIAAIRQIFATYSQTSGEPCDGCVDRMVHNVLSGHVDEDLLGHYSAALDEIYALRAALAVEARTTEVHLEYRSFPKSRRAIAEQQIARMRAAATQPARYAYGDVSYRYRELKRLGAVTLTRVQWEARDDA